MLIWCCEILNQFSEGYFNIINLVVHPVLPATYCHIWVLVFLELYFSSCTYFGLYYYYSLF